MKKARFLRAAVVLVSAVLGAGMMTTASYADDNTGGTGTVNNCKASDFDNAGWTFDKVTGVAKITASLKSDSSCEGDVTLVSYLAPKPNFDVPQYLFDDETYHFDKSHSSHEFVVDVPDCNTQVDLFVGGQSAIIRELVQGGPRYNDLKINYKNFGTSNCVQPAVQHSDSCDGTVTLKLSNDGKLSGYAVDFVVKYGNETKTVNVGKGESKTLDVPAGSGPITVSADKLPATTISWGLPETCKPSASATNDCKVTTITVNNPEGNGPITGKVVYNGETKTVTVPTGKSQDVTFDSAKAGAKATVSFPDTTFEDITVDVVLGDCPNPNPTGSTSTSPSPEASVTPSATGSTPAESTPSASVSTTPGDVLALTGSNSSTIAGGAVLLLLVGAGLFFMARRRKLNFKA